ncbi:MAG: hypothetical protein JJ858_07105 [Rhizobiaceae bacterium]|nr:hypothetical protein [Rhizobiaceae bacterium]
MPFRAQSVCVSLIVALAGATTSHHALASGDSCRLDLNVKFIESAPRDRFVISNNSTSNIEILSASLDLSKSQGNLIFDTEDGGVGVEVFQKFRSETDAVKLVLSPEINDGDNQLDIAFESFARDKVYQFSIDVNDQNKQSDLGQIRVTGGELSGAEVTFLIKENDARRTVSALFDDANRSRVHQNYA